MSNLKILALVFSSLVLAILPSCNGGSESPTPPVEGCTKDTDCKGDRYCSNGQCVDPGVDGSSGTGGVMTGGNAGAATGGAAGLGGTSGSGGAAANGGTAGNSGSSGTGGTPSGGTGGSEIGGASGTSGAGGTGGTDVDAGGTGGFDPDAGDENTVDPDAGDTGIGGQGGSSGTGGSTGTGGTGGNPDCAPDGANEPCYDGPGTTRAVGSCKDGVRTCTNGLWSACVGEVLPSNELCDFADNDCDGAIDNGTLQVGTTINLNVSPGADKPAIALDKAGRVGIIWTKSAWQVWFTHRNQDGTTLPPLNDNGHQIASTDQGAGAWAKDATLQQQYFSSFWGAWSGNGFGTQKIDVAVVDNSGWAQPTADPSSIGASLNPSSAAKPGQTEYGLVFEKGLTPDIYFSRWNSANRTGGVQISNTPEPSTKPRVAWNGNNWVVVWFEGGATNAWRYAVVAENGSSLLANGALDVTGTTVVNIVGAVNAIGATYVAGSEVHFARFAADMTAKQGDVVLATGQPVNGAASPVWNGTLYGVAYSTGSPGDVRLAQVSANGEVGAIVNASASTGDSRSPALASTGTDWFTVWVEGTGLAMNKITRVCQ